MGFDKDEIRFAARACPQALFDHYAIKTQRSSGQLALNWCPHCGEHKRRALLFSPIKLQWHCKVCDARGDIFSFIQCAERLHSSDFPKVLEVAARIWEIPDNVLNADEREQLRAKWRLKEEEILRGESKRRETLRISEHPRSLAYWNRLLLDDPAGASYLARRGLDAVRGFGLCRYDHRHGGAPSLALFTSDGRIKNVIRRPLVAGEKPLGLYECSTAGTLVDAVSDIQRRSSDVVIAEGFCDSLTSKLAWPDAYVLGAHGVGNVPAIARAAAPKVKELGGRLRFVPDRDKAGFEKVCEGVAVAVKFGLSHRGGSIEVVDIGEHDLNDAWNAGWRPAA